MASRRLFFALWPGDEVRTEIKQAAYPRIKHKTTPAENWHLTLSFLGPTSSEQQAALEAAADSITGKAFSIELDVTGYFFRARVAWLGCQHPDPALLKLQRDLETALRAACPEHTAFFTTASVYCPHVTLYRRVKEPVAAVKIAAIHWPVDSFCLIESRPDQRPVYRILRRWELSSD